MNKKYTIAAAIIIILIALGAYSGTKNPIGDVGSSEQSLVPIDTSTVLSTTTIQKASQAVVPKASLLQVVPYTDASSKFSINLPQRWVLQTKSKSTSTSDSIFTNGSSTMTVKRFARTDKVEQVVNARGADAFLAVIADSLKTEMNGYSVVATSSEMINGQKYYKVSGKYMGKTTKKEVTQYIYLALSKDSYYLVGFDIYSDAWNQAKDGLLESVNSFRLLP